MKEKIDEMLKNNDNSKYKQVKCEFPQYRPKVEDVNEYLYEFDNIDELIDIRKTEISQFIDNWFCDRLREGFGFKGDFCNFDEINCFVEENKIKLERQIHDYHKEIFIIDSPKYFASLIVRFNYETLTWKVETDWKEK